VTPTALALALPPPERSSTAGDLVGLRRRLAGATAQEAVVVDFLEDDLREAEAALGEVAGWLDSVADALHDARAGGHRYATLAARDPADAVEYLGQTLASVRRRLGQVASGLGRAAARPRGA
jgi:hypothetical protein